MKFVFALITLAIMVITTWWAFSFSPCLGVFAIFIWVVLTFGGG